MLESRKKENEKLLPLRRFADGRYSVPYLSILVQRKKLKARKIGRNFYTCQMWMEEYFDKHARDNKRNQNSEVFADKENDKAGADSLGLQAASSADILENRDYTPSGRIGLSNTDNNEPGSTDSGKKRIKINIRPKVSNSLDKVGFFVGSKTATASIAINKAKTETVDKLYDRLWIVKLITVCFLGLAASISVGRYYPQAVSRFVAQSDKIYYGIIGIRDPRAATAGQVSADPYSGQKTGRVAGAEEKYPDAAEASILPAGWLDGIRRFISGLFEKISLFFISTESENIAAQEPAGESTSTSTDQGVLVMPLKSTDDIEKVKARISEIFSDRVIVSPDDSGQSGVVKPVFKSAESDEKYLFMMVPVTPDAP